MNPVHLILFPFHVIQFMFPFCRVNWLLLFSSPWSFLFLVFATKARQSFQSRTFGSVITLLMSPLFLSTHYLLICPIYFQTGPEVISDWCKMTKSIPTQRRILYCFSQSTSFPSFLGVLWLHRHVLCCQHRFSLSKIFFIQSNLIIISPLKLFPKFYWSPPTNNYILSLSFFLENKQANKIFFRLDLSPSSWDGTHTGHC